MIVICKNIEILLTIFNTNAKIQWGLWIYFKLLRYSRVKKFINSLLVEFEQDSTNERLHGVILPPRSPVGKTQAQFLPPKDLLWSPKEQYCLFSNREGLGTCRWIMGLATIDPHTHKVQTRLYKIPKFGVNRPKSKEDTAIWKCQNLLRNVWPSRRCPTQPPDAIHFIVNFDVFKSLYLSQN